MAVEFKASPTVWFLFHNDSFRFHLDSAVGLLEVFTIGYLSLQMTEMSRPFSSRSPVSYLKANIAETWCVLLDSCGLEI